MKKSNQLTVFVLFLFVASLVSCEKEKIAEEQEPAIATEIASIKEVKETFLKQNKSIHLFTGKSKNLQARNDSISNYFIDWKNTKKATFKEGVTILSTPVIRQFIDKRERSFIASFKNGDTIEQRFFIVYCKKGIDDSSPFSGYLLKFKIDTEFEALYRYKEGVLVATYVPQKSKLQHRYDDGDCKPAPEKMTTSLDNRSSEEGGYEEQGVVQFECLLLTATVKDTSGSNKNSNGDVFTWHNPSHHLDNLLSNAFMRNHSNNIVGGGGSYNGDLNDINKALDSIKLDKTVKDNPCVEKIINKLKKKDIRGALIPKLEGNSHLSQSVLELFENSSKHHLTIKIGEAGNDSNGNPRNARTDKFTIILDDDMVEEATDLSIARTLIHEMIHTYINYKLKTDRGSNFFNELDDYYQEVIKEHPNNANNITQHAFMSEFVDAMAISLSAYDFNRQDISYYKNLCWAGLESSENYKELDNQTEIQNTIENERLGKNKAKGSKCD